MKTWAWSAAAIGTAIVAACGGGNSGTGTGTGGTGGTSTATTSSSSSGMMDAVCTDPTKLTQACVSCIGALPSSTACVQSFVTACRANAACNAFGLCQSACVNNAHDAGLMGAGGGGTGCVAGETMGDAGTPEQNCIDCCTNGNAAGADDFFGGLITSCACTAGAPCVAGCK